jgi:hypothetical protein
MHQIDYFDAFQRTSSQSHGKVYVSLETDLSLRKALSGIFLEKPTSSEFSRVDVETSETLGAGSNNFTNFRYKSKMEMALPKESEYCLHVAWFHALKVMCSKSNSDIQSKRGKQPQSLVQCSFFITWHITISLAPLLLNAIAWDFHSSFVSLVTLKWETLRRCLRRIGKYLSSKPFTLLVDPVFLWGAKVVQIFLFVFIIRRHYLEDC